MKTIFNIILITVFSFASYAQDNWDPTDHKVGFWQFRQIGEGDVANFLYNEDNVYRNIVKNQIAEGNMVHWGLARKLTGNTSSNHNYFFYNGFAELSDLDSPAWGSGSNFGLRPVSSAGVLGAVYTSPAIQVFAETPKPGNYIVVNTANPSNVGEFVRLQNEVWKPFIKDYINDENSPWAGWEVATVMSPTGNGAGYSVVTIDHYTTLSGALNSFPNGAEWPEGLQAINDLLPNGKFTTTVIYEVKFYEGPAASK